jgi:methyltransferase family protein
MYETGQQGRGVNSKALGLVSLLPRRPGEFLDRISAFIQVKMDRLSRKPAVYSPEPWDAAVARIAAELRTDFGIYLTESGLQDIEADVLNSIKRLPPDSPFESFHNGDLAMARLAYAICRVLKPVSVVETGTCYGVSSSFILKALSVNGQGTLHSIDLPPLGRSGDQFVGILIPQQLRTRWQLHRGASRRVLPILLSAVGKVDFFLHDSLHTYSNIMMECRAVGRHLQPPAAVMVDDIQDNAAFLDWIAGSHPTFATVIQEINKNALLGLALFAPKPAGR